MMPTKANVQKAIKVRFKGASMNTETQDDQGRWVVNFRAPKYKKWFGSVRVQTFVSKPDIKKQDLWAACLNYIDSLPELELAMSLVGPEDHNTPAATMLEITEEGFRFPTGKELDDAIKYLGLKYGEFCTTFNVDVRSLKHWRDDGAKVPYPLWRLILIYSGKVLI